MLLSKIKKGYYTDGTHLYTAFCGKPVIFLAANREEKEIGTSGLAFTAKGNTTATLANYEDIDVKKCKVGQEFFNGEIKIIDKDVAEILSINPINAVFNTNKWGDKEIVSCDGYKESRRIWRF